MTVDTDRVANLDDRDVEIIQFVLESHSSDTRDRIYFLTPTPMSEWDEVGNWSDPPQKLIDFVSSNGNKYRPASMGGGVMTSIYEKIDGKWKWKAKGNGENWISCNKRRNRVRMPVSGHPPHTT